MDRGAARPDDQMANPVVRIHGTASIARLVCPLDPVAASGLYRDAITSLFNVLKQRLRRALDYSVVGR